MLNFAILIDGGFAKRKLNGKSPAKAEHFKQLIDALSATRPLDGMRLHRVYYYDSMPLESCHENPISHTPIDFGKTDQATRIKGLYESLKTVPFLALRLGELAFRGWNIPEKVMRRASGDQLTISATDLEPQIAQKGVDMRIGMDIAALTLKKQVDVIVLVTGDSDFVPAMKFARREGALLFLVTLGHRVKTVMIEHSDLQLDIALPSPKS